VPADELEKIVPALEALESAFRPLQGSLPPDADIWTPADVE
jgi:hypothetical protein